MIQITSQSVYPLEDAPGWVGYRVVEGALSWAVRPWDVVAYAQVVVGSPFAPGDDTVVVAAAVPAPVDNVADNSRKKLTPLTDVLGSLLAHRQLLVVRDTRLHLAAEAA